MAKIKLQIDPTSQKYDSQKVSIRTMKSDAICAHIKTKRVYDRNAPTIFKKTSR